MQSTVVSASANPPRTTPFQVRGAMQTLLSLRVIAPDDPNFFPLLVDKIAHSPDFFRSAPLLLDLGALPDDLDLNLSGFVAELRAHRLAPVGVQNASAHWTEAAAALGLPKFAAGGTPAEAKPAAPERKPAPVPKAEAAPPPPAPSRGPAMVLREPVRGGQQIITDGDLVVLAAVGHGAELAAAGHIHVYGVLRGRAFAGIEGDENAMIFTDDLQAELLSIAGVHMVNEEIGKAHLGKRVRCRLDADRLILQAGA